MERLTNRSKIVSDKKMTFLEKIYLPAILSGIRITIKHMFKKHATVRYPEKTREFSEIYRGMHVLKRDDNGAERCTATLPYETRNCRRLNRRPARIPY